MGQAEVLEFLESKKGAYCITEIAQAIFSDPSKVSHALQKLVRYKEVKFVELTREHCAKIMPHRKIIRRMRFYFDSSLPVIEARKSLKVREASFLNR